jgi:hypothetical protein
MLCRRGDSTRIRVSDEKTSEEAKAHAREILSAAGYNEYAADEKEHQMRVMAGYKAALTSECSLFPSLDCA